MNDLILEKIAEAAFTLGLDKERVMTKSLKDNLTLPRPRVELDFLPETHQRTGRLLGGQRVTPNKMLVKKELYEVSMPVAAQILADDPAWLKIFAHDLIKALPRGFNDQSGNYVKIQAKQGTWENTAVSRVGGQVIEPIVKRGYLLHITATFRLTEDELIRLIDNINFKPKMGG